MTKILNYIQSGSLTVLNILYTIFLEVFIKI